MKEAFSHLRNTLALVKNFNKIDLGVKDGTFEIFCKKKIATATDMQYRTRQLVKFYINQICHRIILNETLSLDLHPEGIHLSQILVISRFNHTLSIYYSVAGRTRNSTDCLYL